MQQVRCNEVVLKLKAMMLLPVLAFNIGVSERSAVPEHRPLAVVHKTHFLRMGAYSGNDLALTDVEQRRLTRTGNAVEPRRVHSYIAGALIH